MANYFGSYTRKFLGGITTYFVGYLGDWKKIDILKLEKKKFIHLKRITN